MRLVFLLITAISLSTASIQAAEATAPGAIPGQFALGIGYPDLRARWNFSDTMGAEAKFAYDGGVQVYSAKFLWQATELGAFKLMLGGEAGFANFSDVESISGSGVLAGALVSFEYPIAKIMRLSLGAGPVWMQASSEGQTHSNVDVVFDTALYFYLF